MAYNSWFQKRSTSHLPSDHTQPTEPSATYQVFEDHTARNRAQAAGSSSHYQTLDGHPIRAQPPASSGPDAITAFFVPEKPILDDDHEDYRALGGGEHRPVRLPNPPAASASSSVTTHTTWSKSGAATFESSSPFRSGRGQIANGFVSQHRRSKSAQSMDSDGYFRMEDPMQEQQSSSEIKLREAERELQGEALPSSRPVLPTVLRELAGAANRTSGGGSSSPIAKHLGWAIKALGITSGAGTAAPDRPGRSGVWAAKYLEPWGGVSARGEACSILFQQTQHGPVRVHSHMQGSPAAHPPGHAPSPQPPSPRRLKQRGVWELKAELVRLEAQRDAALAEQARHESLLQNIRSEHAHAAEVVQAWRDHVAEMAGDLEEARQGVAVPLEQPLDCQGSDE